MKIQAALLLFLACAIFGAHIQGCSPKPGDMADTATDLSETATAEPENDEFGLMGVFVFDIGKADAILITTENYTVMIDAGENKNSGKIAKYMRNHGIAAIDCLIITHFHKDHIGGAGDIIDNFEVKKVVVPNYGKESKHYERFAKAMAHAGIESFVLADALKFTLDGAEFALYPTQSDYAYFADGNPGDDDYDEDAASNININENDFSIVTAIRHGENNFLFAGDAMAERLGELLSENGVSDIAYDYLKVPHHGRYNERSAEFIDKVKPKYAVITCSHDKPADKRVTSALEEAGAHIFYTANDDVYCKSDGKTLTVGYQ